MACVHLRTNYSFHRNTEHSYYFNLSSTKNRISLLYKPRMTIFSAKHAACICNIWNFSRLVVNEKAVWSADERMPYLKLWLEHVTSPCA